jgi:hypothetical protein
MKILDIRIKEQIRTKAKKLPMYDSFMRYVEHHEKYRNCETLKDMLLDTFKWDQTREGHDYWQGVFDSIETVEMPACPKCNQNHRVYWRPQLKEYHCPNCYLNYK